MARSSSRVRNPPPWFDRLHHILRASSARYGRVIAGWYKKRCRSWLGSFWLMSLVIFFGTGNYGNFFNCILHIVLAINGNEGKQHCNENRPDNHTRYPIHVYAADNAAEYQQDRHARLAADQ